MTEAADAPDRDVLFVTIDCWRHDALERMPNLVERTRSDGYVTAESICAAPATRGAFAAIFGGRHYPRTYAGFDRVADDVESLPSVFSRAGYATGGFVGSNPFLNAWKDGFDEFWNDRLDAPAASGPRERLRELASSLRHATSYLRMDGRVSATDVAARARRWYRDRAEPRFCWLHLMDPHVPFLPGFRRAMRVGPVSVYRSHRQFERDPHGLTEADRETLRECYRLSLDYLDAQLASVLEFVDDDAVVVLVGDHGEEFDHGGFGHARLYDETVRVPLVARGIDAVDDGDTIRQLDLGATLCSSLGLSVPDGWTGRPHDGTHRDAFILNHSTGYGNVYAGIRTDRYKYVRTADENSGEVLREEAYDLVEDPAERTDLTGQREFLELADRLDAFLEREGVSEGLLERPRDDTSAVIEDRLAALGYK